MNKKLTYLFIAALFHMLAPWFLTKIVGNLINGIFSLDSEGVYTFLKYIFYGISAFLVIISFHQTKPNEWNLWSFLGDMVGTLRDGTGYVPLGFLRGAVQTYTKSQINFTEVLHVIKLKNDGKLDYEMEIKIEGAFYIVNPLNFFTTTGLKEFKKESFDRKRDKFYSTVIADLSSNIDTIAAQQGYAKFRKKTDWTLEEILEKSKEITEEDRDSLKETFLNYGLGFDKISTYTKYDAELEKILKGQSEAEAKRGIDMYKAETEKKVKKINAQAEVVVSKERAKAIKHLTEKIAEIPEYKELTASEVKEMVEASMDIWDSENLSKQILDIKGLPEIVKGLVPIVEKLLQAAINKKTA